MSSLPMGSRRHRRPQTQFSIRTTPGTQSDEDDATRKAVLDVVQVWLDRLQLVSVITTFFASIDGLLLGFSANIAQLGVRDVDDWDKSTQVMVASFSGALIFHVSAAMTSFIGSFVLIRYKLLDAKNHEHEIEESTGSTQPQPPTSPPSSPPLPNAPFSEKSQVRTTVTAVGVEPPFSHASISSPSLPIPSSRIGVTRTRTGNSFQHFAEAAQHSLDFIPTYWTDIVNSFQGRVYISRVHPFAFLYPYRRRRDPEGLQRGIGKGGAGKGDSEDASGTQLEPPVKLLTRCHSLSSLMSTCGFTLACLGILAFLWTALPQSVGIFGSACMGACLVSGMFVFNFS